MNRATATFEPAALFAVPPCGDHQEGANAHRRQAADEQGGRRPAFDTPLAEMVTTTWCRGSDADRRRRALTTEPVGASVGLTHCPLMAPATTGASGVVTECADSCVALAERGEPTLTTKRIDAAATSPTLRSRFPAARPLAL